MVQKKIAEKRASRISAIKKLPKVNATLAAEFLSDQSGSESDNASHDAKSKSKKKRKDVPNILQDDRFKSMFADQDFQVDTTSQEYKLHHPSESQTKSSRLAKRFEAVDDHQDADSGDDEIVAPVSNKKKRLQFLELKVIFCDCIY